MGCPASNAGRKRGIEIGALTSVVIGASGGIGRALADALKDRGPVHRLSRPELDVTDEAGIASAAARIGPVDHVIVATGLLHDESQAPEKTFRALDAAALARSFAINAIGPALVAKHFLPLLPRDRRSVFAALSAKVGSISDNRLGGWYGYRASKAALNQLIRTASIELRRTHPLAICVGLHPGTVDTRLSAPFQRGVPDLFTPDRSTAALLAVLDRLTPEQSGRLFAWDGAEIAP